MEFAHGRNIVQLTLAAERERFDVVLMNGFLLRYGVPGGKTDAAMTLKDDVFLIRRELSFKRYGHKKYFRFPMRNDAPCGETRTAIFPAENRFSERASGRGLHGAIQKGRVAVVGKSS